LLLLRSNKFNDFCKDSLRHTLGEKIVKLLWANTSSDKFRNFDNSSGTSSIQLWLRSSLVRFRKLKILESILFIRHSDTWNNRIYFCTVLFDNDAILVLR
jgi:hypothetical protein